MQAVRTPKVTVIPAKKDIPLCALSTEAQAKLLRVAAYARVSTDSAEQLTSYRAQVDYYTRYIAGHDGWALVEVYTDEGISGTTIRKREGFQRMIADALAGKIDLIEISLPFCPQHSRYADDGPRPERKGRGRIF